MNKKIIKSFLFSLILFGCFFFINDCSALSIDEIYNDLDYCYKNNYYGETLEQTKTVSCDEFRFIEKEELINYLSSKSNYTDIISYITNAKYYAITNIYNASTGSYKVALMLADDTDFKEFSQLFQYFIRKSNGNYYTLASSTCNVIFTCDYSNNSYSNCSLVFKPGTTGGLSDISNLVYTQDLYLQNCFIMANFPVSANIGNYHSGTNSRYVVNETLCNSFTVHDTTIEDKNSNIKLTYSYSEDTSTCHVDATILNGAFSDKLYYSYQMPSIAGQGLVIGKTQFPLERFRY